MSPDTDIAEAREALSYWSKRADRLPWHRRADRREARELAARWRARLIVAYLERWRLGRLRSAVTPLFDTGGRSASAHARRLAWTSARRTSIGRRIITVALVAAGITATAMALTMALVLHALGAV